MSAIASQITSLMIIYSRADTSSIQTIYSIDKPMLSLKSLHD